MDNILNTKNREHLKEKTAETVLSTEPKRKKMKQGRIIEILVDRSCFWCLTLKSSASISPREFHAGISRTLILTRWIALMIAKIGLVFSPEGGILTQLI